MGIADKIKDTVSSGRTSSGRSAGPQATDGRPAWKPGDAYERIVPPPPKATSRDTESLDVWGFDDSKFEVNKRGKVEMTGSRYALSGEELPDFIEWAKDVIGVDIDPADTVTSSYPTQVAEPNVNETFVKEIRTFMDADQLVDDDQVRLRHGHGHTVREMYEIKHGKIVRIPDLVVEPRDAEQVAELVRAAVGHDVSLIPYGGGTCVTEALLCPEDEKRMIVSVDMGRMNRILWIDPVNRLAEIEAGAVGRNITSQLAEYGFTMGHEPDSVEFSTMGGWVATNASGMKKNRYGNIEDLVLDVNVVGADGTLSRSGVAPRESVGLDPRAWIFGSEGNLGIITSAVVKIFPLPEVQRYGSVIFPTFEDGVAFMYELTQAGDLPASVRLVDNLQFQFSMVLKPASKGLGAIKSKIEKLFVTKVKGFDVDKMVACTLVFEGSEEEVKSQENLVYRLASDHSGMKAGGSNGERGYALTFAIAYIRDFIMRHHILGESFETSVAWSDLLTLVENVKQRVADEQDRRGLPGKPFISARVTQLYDTGVCVYFYMGVVAKGVDDPIEQFAEIEEAARSEILAAGGSLSHHHGVGKLRKQFLPEIMSDTAIAWNRQAKDAIDPTNVFGAGNLAAPSEVENRT